MQAEDSRPLGDDNAGQPVIDPRDRPTAAKRRPLLVRLLPLLIVVVALGGFGGIVGYYYFAGSAAGGAEGVAPLIRADQRPVRVRPENPGGMDVPHQDKEIYDRVASRGTPPSPTAERLLPPPETPLPRPAAPAAAAPGAAPATPSTGAVTPPPPSTLSAIPPRPPGAPPPQQASIPPPPDMTPPPAASVATIPPPVAGSTALPRAAAPSASAPPAAAPQPAAASAPRSAGSGGSRVVLASVQSQPDAQREWERLRRQHPDALAGLTPDFVRTDLGERGIFWRIYVGPAESGAEAQARCAALKQRQVGCFVARP